MNPLRHRQDSDQRTSGLTAAERARTIIASASSLQVGVLNLTSSVERHAVAPDGSVLFVAGADAPERVFAVGRNLAPQSVQMRALDVGSIAQADRIRGSLALTGRLGLCEGPLPVGTRAHLAGAADDGGPVLRLEPTKVSLTWLCEVPDEGPRTVEVSAADYTQSIPDPLLPHEAEWLTHLHRDHGEELRILVRRAMPDLGGARVRPQCLDRFGLVLRVAHRDGRGELPRDVRLDFARPLRCGCELHDAFLQLLEREPA